MVAAFKFNRSSSEKEESFSELPGRQRVFLSCPEGRISHWVEVTENRRAITRLCEPLLVGLYKHNFIYLTLQPGRQQQVTWCHMKLGLFQILTFCDAIHVLGWIFFSLSDSKVFEINLIIMSQGEVTLSCTLCGPTVPRTIKKYTKSAQSILAGRSSLWYSFISLLLLSQSLILICFPQSIQEKNCYTHMHGYLEGNRRRIEKPGYKFCILAQNNA